MLFRRPSAPRSFCTDELKVMFPDTAAAFTCTGQFVLMLLVSTFREKMRCSLVVPPSGVVMASKKSERDVRSTMGVPVMPSGSMSPHGRLDKGTGAPTFRCQMIL